MRAKNNYIGAPACFRLELAMQHIHEAFGSGICGAYQVGSSLDHDDWRDVDVRFILEDAEFARLFPDADEHWEQDPRWLLLTVAISAWLKEQTGLPIDFQFQPQTHANKHHRGMRNAVGMRIQSERQRRLVAQEDADP